MPEPLDYRNPRRRDAAIPPVPKLTARTAIPIDFDTVLTRTQDHGAVRAVENQLKRGGIEAFRSEEGDPANRWVELHVRASDYEKASQIAGEIFARRQKLNSFPRQVVEPPRMPGEPDGGSGIIF
ncbi:hypothetical protein BH09PLA1_BH09PLA1_21730 [soil metagenome]